MTSSRVSFIDVARFSDVVGLERYLTAKLAPPTKRTIWLAPVRCGPSSHPLGGIWLVHSHSAASPRNCVLVLRCWIKIQLHAVSWQQSPVSRGTTLVFQSHLNYSRESRETAITPNPVESGKPKPSHCVVVWSCHSV